jgi:ketosteroid isomerase-like protein
LILRNTARAMSQENVEIVRASLDAWNERDMDALRERYSEDVVTWPPIGWPEEGPFVGRDTVTAHWERMRGLWDEDEMEMLADYIDAADRVAVRMTWRDRSGSLADSGATGIFTIAGRGFASPSSSGTTRKLSKPWGFWSRKSLALNEGTAQAPAAA